jgi:hypothetical protein
MYVCMYVCMYATEQMVLACLGILLSPECMYVELRKSDTDRFLYTRASSLSTAGQKLSTAGQKLSTAGQKLSTAGQKLLQNPLFGAC